MEPHDAFRTLGLHDGMRASEARTNYRRLLLQHHPDHAGPRRTAHASDLIEAFRVVQALVDDDGFVRLPPDPADREVPAPWSETDPSKPDHVTNGAHRRDTDTIAVPDPAHDTFPLLEEAAARVGAISYVDRESQILEFIVREDGGPSCSVMCTLQGRAEHTEIFCTIESIEAAPAPPLNNAIEALVRELRALAAAGDHGRTN